MRALILLLSVTLTGCRSHPGQVDEPCRKDGTCEGKLLCQWSGGADEYRCRPEAPKERCHFESECFCMTCADKCGATGVRECSFSDTTTWGAKPTVCTCK